MIDEGGIGAGHLADADVAGTETEGHRGMDLRISDTELVEQVDEGLRIELAHEVG